MKLLDCEKINHSNSKCNHNLAVHNSRRSRGKAVDLAPNFRRLFQNPCVHGYCSSRPACAPEKLKAESVIKTQNKEIGGTCKYKKGKFLHLSM